MEYLYDRICARIDLDAIERNIENIRARLPEGTGLVGVVKADAYGHGSKEIVEQFGDKLDMAAVACVDEGAELRPVFKKPILVLGYTAPDMFGAALENDITLTVFNYESAEKMAAEALKRNKTMNVHIAVDTGMKRIGFLPTEENALVIANISKLKGVRIKGVFTHFARADERSQETTDLQMGRFTEFTERLEKLGVELGVKHISNSALIMQNREKFDVVRAGIILYGLYPSEEVDKSVLELTPAMELVTRIVNIFDLKKGEGISYGHTFVADCDKKVATLSAGYADGVKRSLSNKGYVLIKGKKAAILGRVCMDQMMVDVTDVPEAEIGDEAEIFGKHLPVEEVSELADSFNYEMVCGVSRRVPRVYTRGGKPVFLSKYIK